MEDCLPAEKIQRLQEMMRRLKASAPFADGEVARMALEEVMRDVEDEMSGIPENPNAALAKVSDGRMYPPDDRFEIASGSSLVRTFKQVGHRTSFGTNGSLKITRSDGNVEIDLAGADGKKVTTLLMEQADETN
jgi:hypothetical protein